ncbi:hypothetical protein OH76DRAFT_896269 [Lentinus brumalis]|uniref:C2H2-type domain-containing protein n=1 Tax=Lentinus brumalis TaxID=2498619 RepID=A0A371D0N6_9APHY|nr:hypothetical protein OH76DRAFT_896269 [Polyporus brumalis]
MTLAPKTVFCYECRKGFRTEKGCRAHGTAKKHQWQTPSGAALSIDVPTAPRGLAVDLYSQVVTLAAHVQGEHITSQFVYCPLCARRWGTWFELNRHYTEEHPVDPALKDVLRKEIDAKFYKSAAHEARPTNASEVAALPTVSDSRMSGEPKQAVLKFPAANWM